MCLKPLTIRNPTKVVNTDGGQLLRLQVPCNKCAECLQAKRNEWYIRTHYEVERTLSLGGYVYFDTLTYNDDNLPKLSHFLDIAKYGISDFSCFNLQHFKAFIKRLRRKIAYHCGVKSNAFRYFLTSEYGEDDRYTHRPHYHILFFVNCGILPMLFSQFVADCWQYGRTDGYPFKPWSYVQQHIYGANGSSVEFKVIKRVCMYVSKYITKSSKFVEKLSKRINLLRSRLECVNKLGHLVITDENDELIKKLVRTIDMFHRQSQGFGLSYLEHLTPFKLMFLDDNKVVLKDDNQIVKTYPCPMYYLRKLFYTVEKRPDKTTYWQPTVDGIRHILNAKLRLVDKRVLSYMDVVNNCSNPELVNQFFRLMDGRDISALVIYELFYKGRHRHINAVNYELNQQLNYLTDEEDNLYDWLLCHSTALVPYLACRNSSLLVDEGFVRTPIKNSKIDDFALMKYGEFSHLVNNSRKELFDIYVSRYTFDENSCECFRHFDKIGVLLGLMTEQKRTETQQTFDFLEDLKSRYKVLFNNNLL